jgi:hypothetical protein
MRSHGKAFVRQPAEKSLFAGVEKQVINLLALLANEMLMRTHQRVEVLRVSERKHLKPPFADKLS